MVMTLVKVKAKRNGVFRLWLENYRALAARIARAAEEP